MIVHFTPGSRDPEEQPVNCEQNASTGKEINGAYGSLHDAHFYSKVVYDMYHDTAYFGGAPWPNLPIIWVNVHYLTMDSPVWSPNGWWDGKSLGAWFNDGDKKDFHPAGSRLELVAHELTHAFTEAHSGLGGCFERTDECVEAHMPNELYSNMAGPGSQALFIP